MPTFLDLASWPRRDAFEYFRGFDNPYFNVCTRLDVARLKRAVADAGVGGLALAYHYLALRLANELEPFRYRLRGAQVLVHPVVHGSTTVLRQDQSFGFAYLAYQPDYAGFAARGAASMAAARAAHAPLDPQQDESALLHFTTLPWVHFTSFSHARNWGREDSVPKFAFGRIEADGTRQWLPMAVEVHHALMDGVHVGQFVQRFEAALQEPEIWLDKPAN